MESGEDSSDDFKQAVEAIYQDLRRLAAVRMRRERPNHTLQPTALVNEAYLRLATAKVARKMDRVHLIAMAARQMHRVLADHGRAHRAAKRPEGAAQRVTLTGLPLDDSRQGRLRDGLSALDLDLALSRLRKARQVAYEVAVLRVLGGLTEDEVAAELRISRSTVTREWRVARAALMHDLAGAS